MTVSGFPINPPAIAPDFLISIVNLHSPQQCVLMVDSAGFRAGAFFFNGVQGVYENYSQLDREFIVDFFNQFAPPGCNKISLSDLYVTQLLRNTEPIFTNLDAATIQLGENSFPSQ